MSRLADNNQVIHREAIAIESVMHNEELETTKKSWLSISYPV